MSRRECGRGEGSGGEEREGKETDRCPLTDTILGRRVQPSVEFEYDGDRICVPRKVDEIFELVEIWLHLLFALVVAVGL
jgi:hypothetical protein